MRTLFPPYLDKGSVDEYPNSGAGPVNFLTNLLIVMGFAVEGVEADGEYGEKLTESVRNLQRHLGFAESEVDGNFGPATRVLWAESYGVDVNRIPIPGSSGGMRGVFYISDKQRRLWRGESIEVR